MTILRFNPVTGKAYAAVETHTVVASDFRATHPNAAWLFNPWSGRIRDPRDIATDVFGLALVPPEEHLLGRMTATEMVERNIAHQTDSRARALDKQEGGDHYKNMAIQPIEFIFKNGIGYAEGNVIKYVTRWRSKNGVEDLKKARHYLDLLIESESGHA